MISMFLEMLLFLVIWGQTCKTARGREDNFASFVLGVKTVIDKAAPRVVAHLHCGTEAASCCSR